VRRYAAAAALSVGALSLSACQAAGSPGELVVYNGQHPQTTAALVAAFEHATGIPVSVRSDDESLLADQIVEEGRSSPADVIITENTPALEFLESRGLLARLPTSILDRVPRADRSPRGDWVGVTARVSVLVYNTERLSRSELPKSILDLASPRWRGELAIAPEETDFQPVVTAVARAYGRARALAWLSGIEANGAAHTYADNETVTAAVNSGQAELGVIDQYYWFRLRAEVGSSGLHSAIAFFAPGNPGYVVDVSGAAVLASTRRRGDAERFVAFLDSREGQRIIARSDSFEYPLVPGVRAAPSLPPLASLRPYPISLEELGDGAEAVMLMRLAGLLP
jgi:iron(III) transport system substrate-binding protein